MASGEKEAVLRDPQDAEKGCCSTGCCSGACCRLCCKACCLPCSLCCPTCCRPGCGCMRSCLCFVPRLLCSLPRKLLGCHRLRCVLIAVLLLGLLLLVVLGALLMWLRAEQLRDGGVLRAGAERSRLWGEDAVSFYVDSGDGEPGTVVFDYGKLLLSYRAQLSAECFLTRMDGDQIPGLDAAVQAFREREAAAAPPPAVAERSLLGPTASILCSSVPIYWA